MTSSQDPSTSIIRDLLYVDPDKVRSVLAQFTEGIAEETRTTTRRDRQLRINAKIAEYQNGWGGDEYRQKSMADALFPELETILEAEGILFDLSDSLREEVFWLNGDLQKNYPAGTFVRITGSGYLFDTRYVAKVLGSYVSAASGLHGLGAFPSTQPQSSGRPVQRNPQPKRKEQLPDKTLESEVPDFPEMESVTGVSVPYLRSLVTLSKGLFTPGLHMSILPTERDDFAVNIRLQEGRQYLDSDVEVLFARYGHLPQQWTAVGLVGHHAEPPITDIPPAPQLADTQGIVQRARTAQYISKFMQLINSLGFADSPQYPGFSVIPLAVYRTIPMSPAPSG